MTAPSPVLEHILQQQVEGTSKLHRPNNRLLTEMMRSCKCFVMKTMINTILDYVSPDLISEIIKDLFC
jgi:tRNA(His) 5'-end guanylyltransferase